MYAIALLSLLFSLVARPIIRKRNNYASLIMLLIKLLLMVETLNSNYTKSNYFDLGELEGWNLGSQSQRIRRNRWNTLRSRNWYVHFEGFLQVAACVTLHVRMHERDCAFVHVFSILFMNVGYYFYRIIIYVCILCLYVICVCTFAYVHVCLMLFVDLLFFISSNSYSFWLQFFFLSFSSPPLWLCCLFSFRIRSILSS